MHNPVCYSNFSQTAYLPVIKFYDFYSNHANPPVMKVCGGLSFGISPKPLDKLALWQLDCQYRKEVRK